MPSKYIWNCVHCLAWFIGSVAKKVESRGFELVTTPGRLTVQQPLHLPWSSPRSSSWTNGGRHKRHDQQICRGELNQGSCPKSTCYPSHRLIENSQASSNCIPLNYLIREPKHFWAIIPFGRYYFTKYRHKPFNQPAKRVKYKNAISLFRPLSF